MGPWVSKKTTQHETCGDVPSGKLLHNYGKSPFSMGNLTISMAIFSSYVKLPEGKLRKMNVAYQTGGCGWMSFSESLAIVLFFLLEC